MEAHPLIAGRRTREGFRDRLGYAATLLSVAVILVAVAAIYLFVFSRGLATFFVNHVNVLDFLFGTEWRPTLTEAEGGPKFGVLPFIVGSFIVTFFSALIAGPIGIGAAIFMTEIAPSWGRKLMQPVIEILVGIPSVVYGFTGLTLIVPFLREHAGGLGFGLLAGILVLAVMILPTVTSISVDALSAVPPEIKAGSYALGATRWQTIWRILMRASAPGFVTAVIFGMARAFGEALAVQMVIGNGKNMPTSLLEPASTITTVITMNMGNTVAGSVENNVLWSLALLLLLMSTVFIFAVRWVGRRGRLMSR
ncbi:MAG: phosphate ABC transporter permease subunit PstC [Hydrogenibacillus schlegelii]|nr:phosphate ABC transporter permease subunit PstC [Hydrogenibacillus schlegelii]MBT9281794.1 phosphate ABC transporter permease subunit PstC [Hydrogenibacillus schlegelii]